MLKLKTRSQLVAEVLARSLGKRVVQAEPTATATPTDALGRPLVYAPDLPRKSRNTVLPVGHQWNGADVRAGGKAMGRRIAQMQARGLRHCDIGQHWVRIAETRILGQKVSCFDCIPETVADVEARTHADADNARLDTRAMSDPVENHFEVQEIDE
jgi:Ni/Co efflux regulator RcnB